MDNLNTEYTKPNVIGSREGFKETKTIENLMENN